MVKEIHEPIESVSHGDPSANVQQLVGNAVKYLEALHQSTEKALDERLKIHFDYSKQIADAETARINELRRVDVAAVATANERAIGQAAVLAAQVAASAETLRGLVATTAENIAKQFQTTSEDITKRIAQLEKTQYENKGRSGISAPLLILIATLAGGMVVFAIQQLLK